MRHRKTSGHCLRLPIVLRAKSAAWICNVSIPREREFPTDIVCPHITFDVGPWETKKFIISANSGKFVHLAEIGNGRSPLP